MALYRGINLILCTMLLGKYDERTGTLIWCLCKFSRSEENQLMSLFIIALKNLTKKHNLLSDDIIVVLAGNFSGGAGFSFIEVGSVQYLKDRVSIKD